MLQYEKPSNMNNKEIIKICSVLYFGSCYPEDSPGCAWPDQHQCRLWTFESKHESYEYFFKSESTGHGCNSLPFIRNQMN